MALPRGPQMEVTMAATSIVNARLTDESLPGYDVRATCAPAELQADGEITVYAPGRVEVASEIVKKDDDPESVAGKILAQVHAANPANATDPNN